ncbi:DUF1203 domain-containing protein [Acidimicrobiaceae bacterium AH-315-P05]|nr:DUF1203 domain-containing protein [Acidimicrobiaceae bacterium AH-315-P05]MBN4047527.1 DUF1203 domain-containing protein [Acidimicrobiaceae bacterium AH-315-P05]
MTTPSYQLHPLSTSSAAALRAQGGEVYVADSKPGYPCRHCLRDAGIGEVLLLVSHDPFLGDSPYRSTSPIFIHADPCPSPSDLADVPVQLTGRQLALRSFDGDEMMIEAAVIDGVDVDQTIRSLLADPNSARVRVYNAGRGCWATDAVRC